MAAALGVLETGSVFGGDYRIVKPLAQGGMGAVYVVDQISTGKARALKIMRAELAGSEDARRRFAQEARIGARIESEHVVEIHSAGVDEATGAPFLVMELLAGEDLATRVARAPLSPLDAADIFEQICHAVAAAHDANIVHRDLKPENVFLAKTRRVSSRGGEGIHVKVLDFGIAKLVAEAATHSGTGGGIGTPLWMAPEQADPGKITPSADVWALGLMLYHALTGRSFWRAGDDPEATYTQLLKEVVLGPIPPATERATEQGVGEKIAPRLDAVFAQTLTRDPKARLPNARALWTVLADALAQPASVPASTQPVPSAPIPAPTPAPTPAPASNRVVVPADRASARQIAAAPLERTAHATPPPLASSAATPVVSNVPRPPPEPPLALQRAAPSGFSFDEILKPQWLILIVCVFGGGMILLLWRARNYVVQSRLREQRDPHAILRPSEPIPLGQTLGHPVPQHPRMTPPARCRLCSGSVTVDGPIDRTAVVDAVERAYPEIDSECLTSRGRAQVKSGETTFSFTIRDGTATNREVVSSTSSDGAQECIVRALRDVRFPDNAATTTVTYQMRYDPNMR